MRRTTPGVTTALLLALTACAPALVPNTFTELSADEQARICAATPHVGDAGRLDYGAGSPEGTGEGSVSPDYRLDCPDLRIRVDGQELTVTAETLDAALAVFNDSAFFLHYYADLRVRVADSRVDADDPMTVPESLRDLVMPIVVTVTPLGGPARTLLSGGRVTPVTLEPGTIYRIDTRTRGTPNPWPSVTIDPQSGTIQATIGR